MPQTKFVLKKALELGLKTIVVVNKIDKKNAVPERAVDKVHDLFLELASNEEQLDFPVFYAIAREGLVFTKMPESLEGIAENEELKLIGLRPLLEKVVEFFPAPKGDANEHTQMLISSVESDRHLGRFLIGRIGRGKIAVDQPVVVLFNGERNQGRIKKIFIREGLAWQEVKSAAAGEIVAIAGIESNAIGGTLSSIESEEALPQIKISDPSVRIKFEASSSPFVGRDGQFVTAKQLQQRLEKEIETNISLKIEKADGGAYFVSGRGELQLSILIEELRREGYEFQVRRPEVLLVKKDDGMYEPMEELFVDVPEEFIGAINAQLSERSAVLLDMATDSGQAHFKYHILTRNLFGLRSQLLTATKGNAVLNNFLVEHVKQVSTPELYRKGVIISSDTGTAMGYSLNTIQERGDLFIEGGTEVYAGMIIGINKYEQDMEVNPTKARQKSGVRMKHDEINQTQLRPVIQLTLEFALGFLAKDELLEVTPTHLRLRKQFLTKTERDWSKRSNLTEFAKQQLGQA